LAGYRLDFFSRSSAFMDGLEFIVLVVPGFAACAEFGFFLFIRPSVRGMSEPDRVRAEQRLLQRFNRVMPLLTGLSILLILIYALRFEENNAANRAVWGALFFFSAATASSIWLNRPIDEEIAAWSPEQLPANWKAVWTRYSIAQGLRASLQFLGFLLLCGSIAAR
jgi:hypothetical protein